MSEVFEIVVTNSPFLTMIGMMEGTISRPSPEDCPHTLVGWGVCAYCCVKGEMVGNQFVAGFQPEEKK